MSHHSEDLSSLNHRVVQSDQGSIIFRQVIGLLDIVSLLHEINYAFSSPYPNPPAVRALGCSHGCEGGVCKSWLKDTLPITALGCIPAVMLVL
jgi:hypothetical protein